MNSGILLSTKSHQSATKCRNYACIYEPDYLSILGPQQPVYNLLNIQMKCYDFTVLEQYQKYVHKTATNMGLDVEDSWATPPETYQINSYKARSSVVDQSYKLNLYERNVQISDFPCSLTTIFFEVLHNSLPEGVQLSIHPHEQVHDEVRYIPDVELIQLKTQLEDMQNPNKGKKKV